MRFIGNHHALHFGGVTFVNRVTLINQLQEEMSRFGKSEAEQEEVTRFVNDIVDQMEEELRQELREKHYHHDLQMSSSQAKAQ